MMDITNEGSQATSERKVDRTASQLRTLNQQRNHDLRTMLREARELRDRLKRQREESLAEHTDDASQKTTKPDDVSDHPSNFSRCL